MNLGSLLMPLIIKSERKLTLFSILRSPVLIILSHATTLTSKAGPP